eukprot:SAG22_NODE_191_length_15699_cov_19.660192_1_plen_252_part_00
MGKKRGAHPRQNEQAGEILYGVCCFSVCTATLAFIFTIAFVKAARISSALKWAVLLLGVSTLYGFIKIMVSTPFVRSRKDAVDKMVVMAREHGATRGSTAVDLGSGDGRVVIALAKAGFQAHGYEFNLPLVLISKWRIWWNGLQDTAFVHWKSMYDVDFSYFNVVTCYQSDFAVKALAEKMDAGMQQNSVLVCNMFKIKAWKPVSRGVALRPWLANGRWPRISNDVNLSRAKRNPALVLFLCCGRRLSTKK